MKQIFQKMLIRGFIVIVSTVLSIALARWMGERFFFDSFYYAKSSEHGYSNNPGNELIVGKTNKTIHNRIKDLTLINVENQENVLGKTDQHMYKLAIIGDSYVYGLGVRQEQRFAELLEKKLNTVYPTKVFVLAQPGDSILDNYMKFLYAEKYYKPNAYIIGIVDNDLMFDWPEKYPGGAEYFASGKSLCSRPLKHETTLPASLQEKLERDLYPSFSDTYGNKCILEQIARDIMEKRTEVIFYSFFLISDYNQPQEPQFQKHVYVLNKYKESLESAGSIVRDPSNTNFTYIWASGREGHPSAKTHQTYADSLYNWILTTEALNFPSRK